jgi:PKD repeat protein
MNQHLPRVSVVALLASAAMAQFQLTAPNNSFATQEGNSNFVLPWNVTTAGGRVQFCHDSSVFTGQGVTTPIRITRLRYRPDAIANTWTGGTYPAVQIDMSTCPVNHLQLSNTFANNHGPDRTTVLNGPVTVIPGAGGSAPAPVYVDITLTTPFVYDPTSGNDLLVDFLISTGYVGNGGTTTGAVDHVLGTNALASRVWISGTPTSPTGNASFSPTLNVSPVCEFSYAPTVGLWPTFVATPTTGPSPLAVQFTDQSVTDDPNGITSWQWDLDGDSVIDSTAPNPTFTYTNCGSYNVTLTTTDALHGSQTITRNGFIVTDTVKADFTFLQQPGGLVLFTDTSVPTPTSWAWDFDGDSIIDSTLQNPIWAYPGCGAFPVSLTASRLCGPSNTCVLGVPLTPNSITTQLTAGTGTFGSTSGNLFDVQVTNPSGINICAVTNCPYTDGTVPLGTQLTCGIYVTDAAGGYQTNHANAAVWRLAATGTGSYRGGNSGSPMPIAMTLDHSIYLPMGTYGMAIYMFGSGIAYRTGSATFTNADLTINAGSSKFGVFSATQTLARRWSGTLHYDTAQTGASAGYGFFGAGCAGSLGVTHLIATAMPRVGGALSVNLDNLPASAAIMMTGFSNTVSAFGPLPIDLTGFGAPGCFGRVSPDATLFLFGAGNTASWGFSIPNVPGFIGLLMFNQALVLDPGFNTLGAVASDATGLMIGN